ncbi:MAG: TrkH family potassium uptake protein [Vulcanimicrobiota bacterium]
MPQSIMPVPARRRKNSWPDLSPSQLMVLSFLALIGLGTLLLSLPVCHASNKVGWLEALFTSTSAVCVTGLAVVDTATDYSLAGQAVILLLFQLGGLGIMLWSSALLTLLGGRLGLRERVALQQFMPGLSLSGAAQLTQRVMVFTLGCELVGAILLFALWSQRLPAGEALWAAVFHSVSAFCNAGFSIWSDSLSADVANVPVNLVVMALIVVGSLGYLVCADVFQYGRGRKVRLSLHAYLVLWVSAGLIVTGALGFYCFEYDNAATLAELTPATRITASFFQSVTTRTAGFNTLDLSAVRSETLEWMVFLMFVGGSPGSTAGGIKTTTLAILLLAALAQTRGRDQVEAHGRSIPTPRILQSVALVVVAAASVWLLSVVLNYLEPHDFDRVLFEATSALATVGLSTGITATLGTPSRLLICLAMLAGRVGPLTLAISLLHQEAQKQAIKYPPEDVAIG